MASNGHGERRAFLGISGRTQFIEQDQRLGGCSARNKIDIGNVGGKGRKILLDRLIVANIREDRIKHRHLGAISGNWNPRLRHQRQQAHGFQCHRFSARVRTGDYQLAPLTFELHAGRNHRDALQLQIALQQRMAGIAQNHPPRCLCTQLHGHAVVFFGEARFGELQFQLTEHVGRHQDPLGLLADAPRHLQQNAMSLRLLFVEQPHQFVVLFDRLEGLDKNGLPTRTGSVHHTLHAPFLLDLHRDDKAFAADRYQLFLRGAAFGELS